jgi:O-antigen ligase
MRPHMDTAKISALTPKTIFFLYCGAFFSMPLGTSAYTIFGIGCLVLWFCSGQFFKQRGSYIKQPWFPPVLFLIALTWFGLLWSTDVGRGLKYAMKTYYWLYAMALASVVLSQRRPGMLIKALMVGLVINAFAAFLQLVKILPKWSSISFLGYTGLHSGYNTLSLLLVIGILMATFYLRNSEGKKEKFLSIALAVVYLVHLMIMQGRGGYVTFILLSPLAVYNAACSLVRKRRLWVVLVLYALMISIFFSSSIVRERVFNLSENLRQQLSAEGEVALGTKYSRLVDRVYMWRWAVELFWEHPLIGVGTGGYRKWVLDKGGDQEIDHPHNNLLYMATSFGVLGLIAFGWLFTILLRVGWRHRNKEVGFFGLASLLAILIGGMTDTHILDSGGMFLLAVTVGIQSALEGKSKTEEFAREHL